MTGFVAGVLLIILAVLTMGGAIWWMATAHSYTRALMLTLPMLGLAVLFALAGSVFVTA